MNEYIDEWPPPEKLPGDDVEEREGGCKKLKLSGKEQILTTEGKRAFSQLASASPSIPVDTLLARWWKEKLKGEKEALPALGTSSANPNTKLFHISKLSAAKEFLFHRITYLSSLKDNCESSYDINLSIAACYHRLGTKLQYIRPALHHVQLAVKFKTDGEANEAKWLLELLERQRTVEEGKKRGMEVIEKWPSEQLKMPQSTRVERRAYSSLSSAEFYKQYALTRTPVIITGIVEKMTATPWTLDYIKRAIGDKIAPVKKVVSGSVEWAQLERAGDCSVAEFVDTLECKSKDPTYLFDWSLPLHCPELMTELSIPGYFEDNFLQQTPDGSLYRESWPSLFIAPAGITSGLHVDAFSSNFWMALFQGKKRWVFFPPEDLPFLYPIYHSSTDATFEVDLSEEGADTALSSHPLLALTHPRECVLEAGELLFVPYGSPHRVENLEKSLAISANFVNGSNLEAVRKELKVTGLLDPRAAELWRTLESQCKPLGHGRAGH